MKKLFLLLPLLALMLGCTSGEESAQCPVLTVEGGQIQGIAADNPGVFVYKGIPYAAAPIGDLRWKEPQPVVPWDSIRICDRFGHPGYQAVHYPGYYTSEWGYGDEAPYSEDCLYLNVYTKAPGQVDKKLPVALWIHGGGYREGWGTEPEFDGQEWASKDVVLVTINYRLGIFGFMPYGELSAESPHGVSGNYGILDQIQSLKWIKANIAQFGGDPDNVTIFGQSAGAGSVRTICESPLARGLFHKAVIMSGGGLNVQTKDNEMAKPATPMAKFFTYNPTLKEAEAETKKVMDWAGLTDLQKLRAASTEILYTVCSIYNMVNKSDLYVMERPIVDGYVSLKSVDEAAHRVLFELTGLKHIYMKQVATFGAVDRDPGERVISIAYCALINVKDYDNKLLKEHGVEWVELGKMPKLYSDHNEMVKKAVTMLRRRISSEPLSFNLLPDLFTLTQLQLVYEAVLGEEIDKRNFRKRIKQIDFIEKTELIDKVTSKRGAALYRFNKRMYMEEPSFKLK